jgi:SAM-dependent methyltransferase
VSTDAPRFATDRRPALRDLPPWARYSFHARALSARITALIAELDLGDGERVLDYGCGDAPYRSLLPGGVSYEGADLPGNPDATLELTGLGAVPGADRAFDLVLSTQVLEHVDDPGLYLSEAFRVLRPGGRLLLTTHGTFVWHPDPGDYWRWTSQGLQRAVTNAGFEIERFEGVVGLLPTALQLGLDAVYWRIPRVLRPVATLVVEGLMRLTDRLHGDESRGRDAQVYAVVGRRP